MAVKTITAATIVWENMGSVEAVSGTVATISDGDTLVSPLPTITNVLFDPTTAVLVVPTFSGATITFKVAAGTPTGRLTIWGK